MRWRLLRCCAKTKLMDGLEEEDVDDGVRPHHKIALLALGPHGVGALGFVTLGLGGEAALV